MPRKRTRFFRPKNWERKRQSLKRSQQVWLGLNISCIDDFNRMQMTCDPDPRVARVVSNCPNSDLQATNHMPVSSHSDVPTLESIKRSLLLMDHSK